MRANSQGRLAVSEQPGSPDVLGDSGSAWGRIAAATVELVGTQGYEGTTVEEIVERAQVKREEFSRLFDGKESCFTQVWEAWVAENRRRVLKAFESRDEWRAQIRAAAYAMLDFLQEDPSRTRFLALGPQMTGAIPLARQEAEVQMYVDLVDAGRQELDDPDSMGRAVANGVVGAIFGMVVERTRSDQLEEGAELVRQLLYVAIRPYLGEEIAKQELRRDRDE